MIIKTSGTQKESQVIPFQPKKAQVLHYNVEYDSMKPVETIRGFVADIRGMMTKYENNMIRITEIEAEMNDIEHYMEIASFKNVPDGYKIYRKFAELRRERRACKNENDLLKPIYDHFHATDVLNKLTTVQGECSMCKGAIDSRCYTTRTDILDEWMDPEDKQKEENADDSGEEANSGHYCAAL